MKKVYPEHISIRTQPKNINKNDLSLFEHELLKTINATTIAQFKNVDILSNIIFSRYKLRFYEKNTNLYPLSMKEKLKK